MNLVHGSVAVQLPVVFRSSTTQMRSMEEWFFSIELGDIARLRLASHDLRSSALFSRDVCPAFGLIPESGSCVFDHGLVHPKIDSIILVVFGSLDGRMAVSFGGRMR